MAFVLVDSAREKREFWTKSSNAGVRRKRGARRSRAARDFNSKRGAAHWVGGGSASRIFCEPLHVVVRYVSEESIGDRRGICRHGGRGRRNNYRENRLLHITVDGQLRDSISHCRFRIPGRASVDSVAGTEVTAGECRFRRDDLDESNHELGRDNSFILRNTDWRYTRTAFDAHPFPPHVDAKTRIREDQTAFAGQRTHSDS